MCKEKAPAKQLAPSLNRNICKSQAGGMHLGHRQFDDASIVMGMERNRHRPSSQPHGNWAPGGIVNHPLERDIAKGALLPKVSADTLHVVSADVYIQPVTLIGRA